MTKEETHGRVIEGKTVWQFLAYKPFLVKLKRLGAFFGVIDFGFKASIIMNITRFKKSDKTLHRHNGNNYAII